MSESPYMGWIVPYSWQEPEYEDDDSDLLNENFITTDMIPEEEEDEEDSEDGNEFTINS